MQQQILLHPSATSNTSKPICNIKHFKTHTQYQILHDPYATSNTSNTTSTAYCIWRIISPVSSLHQLSSSLGLFAEYGLFYRALLQPIAFGESFLQSQISINYLVLWVSLQNIVSFIGLFCSLLHLESHFSNLKSQSIL